VADDGFVYSVELADKVSDPAHAEIRALRELTAEVLKTEKAMLALNSAEEKAAKPKGEREGEGFFSKVAKDATKGLAAATLAIRAIDSIKEGIVEGTSFAIEAADFKEDTTAAYAAVQGTAEEGERTFEAIDKMARVVHMPAEKAHGLAQELMQQGLEDTALITATIGATSSLIREGQVRGAEKLRNIIEKSTASGHFDLKIGGKTESGKALAGLGVQLPNLLDELGHRLGKSREQVKAELKAGKIDTETGIAAIVDTIQNGPIGRAAKSKFGLEEFRADIANTFREAAQDTNLASFNQSLIDAEVALGGISGKQGPLASLFQTIVDGAAKGIETLTLFGLDVEIFALEVELAIGPAKAGFADLIPVLEGVGSAAVDIGKIILLSVVEVINLATHGVEELGAALGFLFDTLAHPKNIGANFDALKKTIADSEADATASLKRTVDIAGNIAAGKDLGQGLAVGVQQATPEVEQSVAFTVKRGIGAGREAADSHSPSREMMDLGSDMSDGLAKGLDPSEVAASIRTGVRGGIDAAGPSASYTGGGAASTEFHMHGNIYINGEPSDDAGMRELVESAMADAFDRFALELGEATS
jgi:hypothetical protein